MYYTLSVCGRSGIPFAITGNSTGHLLSFDTYEEAAAVGESILARYDWLVSYHVESHA